MSFLQVVARLLPHLALPPPPLPHLALPPPPLSPAPPDSPPFDCPVRNGKYNTEGAYHREVQRYWFEGTEPRCTGTCMGNQSMVFKNIVDGCVCPVCVTSNPVQMAMCQRRCYCGDSICAQCFPSSATVRVMDKSGTRSVRRIGDLNVGDRVQTSRGYSEVFAFMDHSEESLGRYLRVRTEASVDLHVSAMHFVFAHAAYVPVMARELVVGDTVWVATDAEGQVLAPTRVASVSVQTLQGLHAPLTREGSLVVDGVSVSSYAHVHSIRWRGTMLLSGHAIGKLLHYPLDVLCSNFNRFCSSDWHDERGRHAWTQLLITNTRWLQTANEVYSDLSAAVDDLAPRAVVAILAQLWVVLALALLSAILMLISCELARQVMLTALVVLGGRRAFARLVASSPVANEQQRACRSGGARRLPSKSS
jgi:hypothetical protein